MKMQWFTRLGLCAGTALALCAPASAASLNGTFGADDALFTTSFTLSGPMDENATIRSLGYAGGINLIGQTIPRGGFDPIVSLFNAAGLLIALSDDGIGVPTDLVSGQGADSLLTLRLSPGVYRVVLSEYDNFPNGDFSAGFSQAGMGNFTAGMAGCPATRFCDPYGNARTGNWALDIAITSIPEPSSIVLALGALALVPMGRRSRRSRLQAATT